MEQYYLHNGKDQLGPYSIADLSSQGINSNTHVWKEGMNYWARAGELDELKLLFGNVPPPFRQIIESHKAPEPKISATYKIGSFIGRNLFLCLGILILVIMIPFIVFQSSQSTSVFPQLAEKSQAELKAELKSREQENPAAYIGTKITMRGNLIGQKVIEGTISNTASAATFKGILIEISFISKTQTVIATKSFTIYEVIKPQQKLSIKKIKIFAPKDTEEFSSRILSATPVE